MSEPLDPPVPPPPPPPPVPAIRISEWLNQAWELIKPYWMEYVLAVLTVQLVVLASELACVLPVLLVAGPMMGGIFVYVAKRMFGLPAQIPDVFKGFRRFADTFILGLALILPPLVFVPLLFLPTILAGLGAGSGNAQVQEAMSNLSGVLGCLTAPLTALFLVVYPIAAGTYLVFALPLVMFRRMGAVEAIRRSIEIVRPRPGEFLVFMLANLVLIWAASFLGGALFCVGFLILSPLAVSMVTAMQLLAYRDFVGLTPEDLAPYAD